MVHLQRSSCGQKVIQEKERGTKEWLYTWANIITTYYFIIMAFQEGKDNRLISSFTECIGQKLTSVSVIAPENGMDPIAVGKDITTFQDTLIFYFGETPLLVKSSVEFMIDPLTYILNRLSMLVTIFGLVTGASIQIKNILAMRIENTLRSRN